jgi:flagellar protein FliJ
MKRFSFSLQKLLDLREFREKQAELELGKAISARDAIQLELDDVAAKRVRSSWERQTSRDIMGLVAIENYITRLDAKKEELLESLAAAELVVEAKRKAYLEATRDRQVLTKLLEKKQAAWRKGNLAKEASTLDDIANGRFKA